MDSFGVQNPATIMKPRKYRLSNNRRGATDTTASSNDSKSQASRRLDPNPKTNEFDIKFETVSKHPITFHLPLFYVNVLLSSIV